MQHVSDAVQGSNLGLNGGLEKICVFQPKMAVNETVKDRAKVAINN